MWTRHFIIFTDHPALQWMFNLEEPTGRLSRWRLCIQEPDLGVKYKKGKEKIIPNCSSYLPTLSHFTVNVNTELPVLVMYDVLSFSPQNTALIDMKTWNRNEIGS